MLYELNTEFNYQIRYTQIDDDSLEIDLIVIPDLKCYEKERDECSVFDFLHYMKKWTEIPHIIQ